MFQLVYSVVAMNPHNFYGDDVCTDEMLTVLMMIDILFVETEIVALIAVAAYGYYDHGDGDENENVYD